MMIMRRRLACCTRDRQMSVDFDEQERIMTYDGLESCMAVDHAYEVEGRTSRRDESATDSLDEDNSSCSSSKDVFGSFSSKYMTMKRDQDDSDEWEALQSPKHFYVKGKPSYSMQFSDVEIMKEKFAKLLLGEDVTGGRKGITTALALSNAISNLAASVFGELWKLEPLSEERKSNWRLEMTWLISPTNYMVELVPAKQYGTNGRILEIMTPQARADVHINLPALQKLDSMLIETLDAMVSTEFWYAEGGSRAEGRSNSVRHSTRWWFPSPRVPTTGLSDKQRKQLICQGKVVHQVFKAARSINESVLTEMPVPTIIRDSFPKAGKPSLGEELFRLLTSESTPVDEILNCLNLKTEHSTLDTINKLEGTIFAWKEAITEQASTGKSPIRTSWSFIRDPISELDKIELLLDRAEALLHQVKIRHPNLPHSFLDATKIQYGKDVGHAIMEAYSRVLGNLAFRILCRIGDIMQEDIISDPNSPVSTCCFPGVNLHGVSDPPSVSTHIRHSLIDHMNSTGNDESYELEHGEAKRSSVIMTPSRSRIWCIGKEEACTNMSPETSP